MKEFDEFDDFDEGRGQSIDIMPYVHKALKGWKKILLWAAIGGAFGVIVALSTPKTFTAKAVVAPELATRSTLSSGLNSLASLAGVNMNTLAITDAMHPDLYPEVIRSTSMCISLFDMPVTVADKDSLVHTDLYDYLVHYCKRPWWGVVLGFPHLAIETVKGIFKEKDEFDDAEGHDFVDSLRITRQQEMVIKTLKKNISASVERKTYVLSIKVTMQDRVIAAQVANQVVANLKSFVVDYRAEKSQENVDYYKTIYEEARKEYLAAQRAYALYSDAHQGISTKSTRVQEQVLQNEAQLHYQMYNQTAQNLLAAEAKVLQEAPVLLVIQPGIAPHIGKPSRAKVAVMWFLLGGVIGLCIVLFTKKEEEKE
jgi:uncharacterized protein involved in exopolysaccharide biosynthesis